MKAEEVKKELTKAADTKKAAILQRFFKTGPGEYGEGDIFLGVTVPVSRKIARQFTKLPMPEIQQLLQSEIHEVRLVALLILVQKVQTAGEIEKTALYNFYLKNTRYINNWDLVDLSAASIVGEYLFSRNRKPLYSLADSPLLWERRIAIISTFYFIRQNDVSDTIRIAEKLLNDQEDLMHKATGWMLRETGKRNMPALEAFLHRHSSRMPRTMLRYAIERFEEKKRKALLQQSRNQDRKAS